MYESRNEPRNEPRNVRLLPAGPEVRNAEERKQRRMMVIALSVLLVALGLVLYRDRDFWFPDGEQAEEQAQAAPAVPAAVQSAIPAVTQSAAPPATTAHHSGGGAKPGRAKSLRAKSQPQAHAAPSGAAADASAPAASAPPLTVTRTVLPPLEVEVVAGDVHRTLHPGTNSVRVDLQPGAAPQAVSVPAAIGNPNSHTAAVTSNAAERVQMSTDTAEVVSRPVKPDYPLLARQMKVQGSVILQALIGRDGLIQDLHVVSGPPILAGAAEEAVKQWHFKPHYQGVEAVETQARITVNFTISTN